MPQFAVHLGDELLHGRPIEPRRRFQRIPILGPAELVSELCVVFVRAVRLSKKFAFHDGVAPEEIGDDGLPMAAPPWCASISSVSPLLYGRLRGNLRSWMRPHRADSSTALEAEGRLNEREGSFVTETHISPRRLARSHASFAYDIQIVIASRR